MLAKSAELAAGSGTSSLLSRALQIGNAYVRTHTYTHAPVPVYVCARACVHVCAVCVHVCVHVRCASILGLAGGSIASAVYLLTCCLPAVPAACLPRTHCWPTMTHRPGGAGRVSSVPLLQGARTYLRAGMIPP